MKKNIVLIINDLKGNGAERVVITLAEEFIRQGHQCSVICFKALIELPISDDVPVLFFPMNRYRWIPRNIRGAIVSRILDRFILNNLGRPDLILSNLLPVDRILSHSKHDNVYLIIHNTMGEEYSLKSRNGYKVYKDNLAKIYNRKPCICVSKGVMQDFKRLFTNQVVLQIYNPIQINKVQTEGHEFTSPYNNYIVHVGKFKQAKRHDILINAFAKSTTTKKLVLIGVGPLQSKMMQLVDLLNIKERVVFAGFQANPYPFIKSASLLVLSSDFEGLGMVLLEAQILRTPVISTDCPSGPREVLPEKSLFPINDPETLAKILDEDSFEHYHSTMKSEFESEIVVQQYLKLTNNK